MLITTTTDTPIKRPTEYLSMVQNTIIVAAPAPHPRTSTGSLTLHITSSCLGTASPVSPPDIPPRVPLTGHLPNPSLIPCTNTKEVPSPPPSSPPPPDLRHIFHTFPLSLTLGPVSSSVLIFCKNFLPTPAPTADPSYLHFFSETPSPPLLDFLPTKQTPSRIYNFSPNRSIPVSTPNIVPTRFYTLVLLLTYIWIKVSLFSPL